MNFREYLRILTRKTEFQIIPKQLSEDLKWRIIYYLVDGYSQKETAKRLYISVGRKKTFNTYDMKILQELITEKVDWFLDELVYEMKENETAKDERSISRAYGYSTINTRAMKSVVFIRGKRYTILPALTLDGIIAAKIIEGSCKNNVIIMDNAVIHHDEALVELIEETGGKVVYLPPYSPDFNPIETAFLTLKA
ncbi:homeodomain-like protein [Rhizophagus clarus]|uniref:Homeodomain-like protein n=2 Tax=Rhizophagus clarus TaxID=94130 RepID=A0A8H3LHG0_9GLOM|nr:homeodomain-like protein [Rhizophagus clarus]